MSHTSVGGLPLRHGTAWSHATQHPFLVAVRDGTLTESAFEAWLVQDYRFVSDLLVFQGRLLARAPRRVQAVLAGGAMALADELAWFEEQAAAHQLDLTTPSGPETSAYSLLLSKLGEADVAVALTALWASNGSTSTPGPSPLRAPRPTRCSSPTGRRHSSRPTSASWSRQRTLWQRDPRNRTRRPRSWRSWAPSPGSGPWL